jgi:glycosyltransferase involved in cell wall biosynthesis
VCGSGKEEFGLAIVEAMAAGLPVVAPRAGGPATYVEQGVTGMLVDTLDPWAIARGVDQALTLARLPETAERTRHVVEATYTIERMAQALAAVYRVTAMPHGLGLPMRTGAHP